MTDNKGQVTLILKDQSLKRLILTLLIAWSFQTLLAAESDQRFQQGNTSIKDTQEDENTVLKIPAVAKLVKLCEEQEPDDISGCLWREVEKPENEEAKKLVENHLKINKGGEKINNFDSLSVYKKDRERNLVLKKMEDFYSQKLKKSLHGIETKDGKESSSNKTVTHDVYYDLAKSQLSKSIIFAVSSYCIEADKKNSFRLINDKSYRQKIKKRNLQNLSESSGANAQGEKTITAYSDWATCLSVLPQICFRPKELAKEYLESIQDDASKDIFFVNDNPDDATPTPWEPTTRNSVTLTLDTENKLSHREYSRMRACEVVNYMEKAKLDIRSLSGIKTRFEEINKEQGAGSSFNLQVKDKAGKESALKIYDQKEKGNGIDDILITTSKDFSKAHEEGVEEELKEFEKCGTIDDASGVESFKGVDEKACERYLNRSKKELQSSIAGDHIKSKVHEFHTKEATKDKKGLVIILKDQGYTEDEANKMLELSEDKIREQINHRYKMKNEAIINSLKVKGQRIAKEDDKEVSFESSDTVEDEDVDKLLAIQKKLKKSTENFTQLVHFNNIVSGYLEITNTASKKKFKNINSIKKEMDGLAEDIDLGKGKDTKVYKVALDKSFEDTDILNAENTSDQEGSGSELGVEKINKFIKYDIDEKKP